jgi:hypothetical protein
LDGVCSNKNKNSTLTFSFLSRYAAKIGQKKKPTEGADDATSTCSEQKKKKLAKEPKKQERKKD